MRKFFFIDVFLLLTGLNTCLSACGQKTNTTQDLKEENAKQILKTSLKDTTIHNVVNNQTSLIKDKITAIAVAEPILFHIYGKKNITKQRPYQTYFIDNYWIIYGSLPESYVGGTFLIIIDSRDNRIIRLTHGK